MRKEKYIVFILSFFFVFLSKSILAIKTGSIEAIFPNKRFVSSPCLSDDQINLFDELELELKKKKIPLEAEIEVKLLELRYLIEQEKIDREKIERKIEEVSNLQKSLLQIQIEYEIQINKLLTLEQKKKIRLEKCPRQKQ